MKVLVTGGNGFLGKHVQKALSKNNIDFLAPKSSKLNLLSYTDVVEAVSSFPVILHMGAVCGGIRANQKSPADFLMDNIQMGYNIFTAVKTFKDKHDYHVYTLGSVCSYPKYCPVPFKEDDLWNGYPEETNAPYGHAKRTLLMMQQTHRQQYGIKGAHLIPVNMYGECFSKDTRLATPTGWKNVADFKVGDDIWTLNPETHRVEREKVTAVQKRKSRKFVNFKGSVIDLRVTPEHKIYYKTNKTFLKRKAEWFIPRAGKDYGMIRFATARPSSESFKGSCKTGAGNFEYFDEETATYPGRISFRNFVSETSLTDSVEIKNGKVRCYKHSHCKWVPLEYDYQDFYEFVGWYVSEGSIVDATNQISISQSLKNPHHRAQIEALLTRMGIEFSSDSHRFYFSSKLWKSFIESYIGKGSDSKMLPEFMLDSTPGLLEVLFDALMKGDGDYDGGRYTTKSTKLKDQFILLLMLTGRTIGKVYKDENCCWRIPIRLSRKNSIKYRDIEVEDLDVEEDVFCVTAGNNHIVYAERNNKPCWVGQCDHFDLENSHVIPALIRKFITAKEKNKSNVEVWGTGNATREFVYVEDVANAISLAVKNKLNYDKPINIGTGRDISIKELAHMIKDIIGYDGNIIFNPSKPDGQPKRMLDVSRAKEILNFEAKTSLKNGLVETINWYKGSL